MTRLFRWLAAATLGSVALVPAVAGSTAQAATAPYTVQTLHFAVTVGPDGATPCDVVGDLYLPAGASAAAPVPAVLATNGFGGSKDDFAGDGPAFASDGYAFLAYSGLGFGGSTCKITLDDPDWDGKAGSQLVSYLGGASGIAYLDAAHTQPAPVLDAIVHDNRGSDGLPHANDPRVGMIGGSYGGEIQFAIASIDPRLDVIEPSITWNNLNYSLDPNNTASTGTGVDSSTPGAAKLFWAAGFSAEGAVLDGLEGAQSQPTRLIPCPNFADWVCPALVNAATTGTVDSGSAQQLYHASVASYLPKIRIPTLLLQGETDTLFNLNEASATYRALKANKVPVKMIWQLSGHSGPSAPGELSYSDLTPGRYYETDRIMAWLDHYLKGADTDLGPNVAYFRDWVGYTGNAAPAYGSSNQFPLGTPGRYYLGSGGLTPTAPLVGGSQTFVTTTGGLPTSTNPIDVLSGLAPTPVPEVDAPGTYASWDTGALAAPVNVAGSPVLHLAVSDPAAALSQAAGPSGQLVLFVRLQDVAPDGTASDIRAMIAPVRIPDVTKPFTVTMPGIVHQFAAGHRVRLIVAGGSTNYRGNLVSSTVTITGGNGQTLDLPTVG